MRKILLIVVAITITAAGLYTLPNHDLQTTLLNERTLTSTLPATSTPPVEPEEITLGRLLMVGHFANTPVASTTALITDLEVGGIIIMSAPENPLEIIDWTREWQAASEWPLLIAIDQEGGSVSRLKGAEFTQAGQRNITTATDAYALGRTRGSELSTLGINMNFAPVLDRVTSPTSFMYDRVFPADTDHAKLAAAMYEGMRDTGVIAVAKHFPGHDDTPTDSHTQLPVVAITEADLPAYTKNFNTYINNVNPTAIMTAHVSFPEIDSLPATLSHFFLTSYLKEELGFTGFTITDDMSMDAIDAHWSTADAAVLSLSAGADMILFAAEPEKARTALGAIKNALKDKTLNASKIREKMNQQKKLMLDWEQQVQ